MDFSNMKATIMYNIFFKVMTIQHCNFVIIKLKQGSTLCLYTYAHAWLTKCNCLNSKLCKILITNICTCMTQTVDSCIRKPGIEGH